MLTDTHLHLYLDDFNEDLDNVISDARKNKVNRFFLPNINSSSIAKLLKICKLYENTFPMIGLHPCYVKENFKQELKHLKSLLEKYKFIAIGEIGIDLHWDKNFFSQQKIAFLEQIEWAKKYKLPIVIHSRNSFDEIYEILCSETDHKLKGIFHCFSGTKDQANKIIDMGFLLGIGGISTFKNSNMDNVLKEIDIKNIVLETDSPYLAPTPFRGKRNQPKYLVFIAEKICKLKNISLDELAYQTNQNIDRVFLKKMIY